MWSAFSSSAGRHIYSVRAAIFCAYTMHHLIAPRVSAGAQNATGLLDEDVLRPPWGRRMGLWSA